jgi:single-strand DNA-binding protein
LSNSFSGLFRLGKDPESKKVGETNLINLNLANAVGFGEKKSTNWLNGQLWGDRWLKASVFLKKGILVWCEGELTFREYTDKEGNKKVSHDLKINALDFAESKKDDSKPAPAPTKNNYQQDDNQDIPF